MVANKSELSQNSKSFFCLSRYVRYSFNMYVRHYCTCALVVSLENPNTYYCMHFQLYNRSPNIPFLYTINHMFRIYRVISQLGRSVFCSLSLHPQVSSVEAHTTPPGCEPECLSLILHYPLNTFCGDAY